MEFPGAPAIKTLPHYRRCGFNPWLGNKDSTCHKLAKKVMRKEFYSPLNSIKSDPNNVTIARHIGEGNGTPLQYSCLENPMDGKAW